MMPPSEQTFLSEGGVLVTNTRFVYAGQTYAMANVTSVRADPQSVGCFAILLLVGGAIAIVVGVAQMVQGSSPAPLLTGLVAAPFGAFLAWTQMVTYVILHTAGEERRTLASKDRAFVARIVAAVNEAIVHRG